MKMNLLKKDKFNSDGSIN